MTDKWNEQKHSNWASWSQCCTLDRSWSQDHYWISSTTGQQMIFTHWLWWAHFLISMKSEKCLIDKAFKATSSAFKFVLYMHVTPSPSHLNASMFEDWNSAETSLSEQSSLQQADQPKALCSFWVLHQLHSTSQAAPRTHTPDGKKTKQKTQIMLIYTDIANTGLACHDLVAVGMYE